MSPIEHLGAAMRAAYPELSAVSSAAGESPVFLVGGAVRDLLLGRGRADIDLVVIGDAAALAGALGAVSIEHERFATAKVQRDGHELDIAAARRETYARPGALPDVEPAADIETDLARRDFTINAMAIPLHEEPRLIDPHDGHGDLSAGRLRVLHARSFVEDPIRALRAARYAARFGFELEPETAERLRATDLQTVSADRREAELLRLAGEPNAVGGLKLLADWGLIAPRPGGLELAAAVADLLSSPPWRGFARRDQAILAAALGPASSGRELAVAVPDTPAQAVELTRGRDPIQLALARAGGAGWLDRYLLEWRAVALEIDGDDLIAAGVPQGPAIGQGLAEALRRKLNGEIAGREEELETALEAAGEDDGVA